MYMPLMVDIRKAVVFGGEREEGLQKTEKMAVFADELLVVPEQSSSLEEIQLNSGSLERVPESLSLERDRHIRIADNPASKELIPEHVQGADFVTSDLHEHELNKAIYDYCEKKNILCNIIDVKDLCNTWFMSVIDTPNMIAGISTKGGCAFYSQRTRIELEEEFDHRSKVSDIFTTLREQLDEEQCNLCTLHLVYREQSMQELLKSEEWEKAYEEGLNLIEDMPSNFHVKDHSVNGLEE